MAGTSLLFGLVLLMLGIALWLAAAQKASDTQPAAGDRSGARSWASRRGATISVVAGLVLFVSRTENVWLLIGITVIALAGIAAS